VIRGREAQDGGGWRWFCSAGVPEWPDVSKDGMRSR